MKICINVNLKPGSLKEIDQFTVKLVLNGLLLGQMYLKKKESELCYNIETMHCLIYYL